MIQEEKKDIILTSKNEIDIIEDELKNKVNELKIKLNELELIEREDKNELEIMSDKIKQFNNIFLNGKFYKKYIDTEQIIEEDKNEENSKSFINYLKTQEENNNTNGNIENNNLFSNIITPKKKYSQNNNPINLKPNLNFNMNINVNINLNSNEMKNEKEYKNYDSSKSPKIKNLFKNIPHLDIGVINLKME